MNLYTVFRSPDLHENGGKKQFTLESNAIRSKTIVDQTNSICT